MIPMIPFDINAIPRSRIPALIAALAARLLEPQEPAVPAAAPGDGDRLLTVEQAAERLGVTKDSLYRNAKTLPFVVRLGPGQLRFSAAGIDCYIRAKTLKPIA
jgi:excisionase family DNA binding protein